MANNRQITYGVKIDVDKASLTQLKNELQSIQGIKLSDFAKQTSQSTQEAKKQLIEIKQSASELQGVLEKSFNTNLGTVNLTRFNTELKKINIQKIAQDLNNVGVQGTQAFRDITTGLLTMNNGFRQSNRLLDSLGTSFKNTIK